MPPARDLQREHRRLGRGGYQNIPGVAVVWGDGCHRQPGRWVEPGPGRTRDEAQAGGQRGAQGEYRGGGERHCHGGLCQPAPAQGGAGGAHSLLGTCACACAGGELGAGDNFGDDDGHAAPGHPRGGGAPGAEGGRVRCGCRAVVSGHDTVNAAGRPGEHHWAPISPRRHLSGSGGQRRHRGRGAATSGAPHHGYQPQHWALG
mmetsp:Transcript_61431/g.194451  ORF Transcript_61431/g.194451 Transcript_61431/m.194451 type:complete len:203 (+) Transcript_61431:344-952(+)